MIEIGILGVFAGIAVAISCFLAYYLIGPLRLKNPALLWLGLAVLAVGLRLAKSIIYFIFFGISPIGLAIGFLALASIGPLYLIYVKAVTCKQARQRASSWFHFLIPLAGAITCFIITPHPGETTLYQLGTALLALYLGYALWIHLRHQYSSVDEQKWVNHTLILMWGAWSSFVLQHLAGVLIYYAYGAIISGLFIFYFFGRLLQHPPIFSRTKKPEVSAEVLAKVQQSFEVDRVFLSVGMSVNVLATEIGIPAYQLTKAVRELYDSTFPEALNHFRVKTFQKMIANPDYSNLTIEYLAEQSGFKTTSSFYTAFKKETGMTPTAFIESLRLKTA